MIRQPQPRRLPLIVSWAFAPLVLMGAAIPGLAAENAPRRPNILLIYADDQSTRTVGCYPESWPWVRTPHIDALAKTGTRFTHCYLGAWCMPSRATMLTGRLPHGIESMRMEGKYPGSAYDPQKCRFWPSAFRNGGYQTAQIGKWHTGTDTGYGRDWDFQIVWNRPKNPDNAGAYYKEEILERNGKEFRAAGYPTDNYTEWACDYIRGEGRDAAKPWYLWLCYGAIHGPSTPAARHVGKYANAAVDIPVDIFPPRPQKPEYLNRSQAWKKGPDGQPVSGGGDEGAGGVPYAQWVRQVNECAMAVDEGVGRVMATLRESGQLENTLVLYTADQGFAMGEHGFKAKLAPYDANYNSPLIVSYPGIVPQGAVSRTPVGGSDLVVTFFRFAGMELPWTMHGRDLSHVFRQPDVHEEPRPLLFENMGHYYGSDTNVIPSDEHIFHGNVPRWVAIRYGKYKYVRTLIAGEMEELYDVEADPKELTNLALQTEHQTLVDELRQQTVAQLRSTGAGFADALPSTKQMKP